MHKIPKFDRFKAFFADTSWWRKVRNFSLLTGEGAVDLGVNLIVMVMVQRSLGEAGLGIFAYLLSLYVLAGFASEFGIPRFLERAVATDETGAPRAIARALYAIFVTTIIVMMLFLVTPLSHISQTRVEEGIVAYFIIAVTLPLRNLNRIRIAVLQGRGNFATAAGLQTRKRLYLLVAIFLLLMWDLPPSLLMLGYLASEATLLKKMRKAVQLPELRAVLWQRDNARDTLRLSREFLLTDETLEVVLYLDFLLLGIFVSSRDLGLYAEASILARIFLLIPSSIKPIFRQQYCSLAEENRRQAAAAAVRMATAFLFFLNSVMALYILLFYSRIMESLYLEQGKNMVPFYVFAETLPGLLFFSTITSQEPVYEMAGKVDVLQKIVIVVAVLNLLLNWFFIPFAGFYGAAFATSASMFAYFMLFGKQLHPLFGISKIKFIIGGTAVYLTYMFFHSLHLSFWVALFLVPTVLFLLLYGIDFFNFESRHGETGPGVALPGTH